MLGGVKIDDWQPASLLRFRLNVFLNSNFLHTYFPTICTSKYSKSQILLVKITPFQFRKRNSDSTWFNQMNRFFDSIQQHWVGCTERLYTDIQILWNKLQVITQVEWLTTESLLFVTMIMIWMQIIYCAVWCSVVYCINVSTWHAEQCKILNSHNVDATMQDN